MNIYNPKIECPMNIVANFRVDTRKKYCKTYDMSKFFVKFTNPKIRSRNRKIQQLIEKYSIDLYPYNSSDSSDNSEDFFILNEKFNELIDDINKVYISGDYLDLMSWLIDRALLITKKVNTSGVLKTNLNKNRPLLMKTLYNLNKSAFLKCFSGNIKNTNK
jgi:hypothetical protein